MQCCADVQATYRKQPTPQLWKEGTGEGQRFFCSLKLPYLSTMSQQFWRRLQLTGVCKRREREDKLITTCLFQSIVTSRGSSFSESNSNNLVFPRTWGIEWLESECSYVFSRSITLHFSLCLWRLDWMCGKLWTPMSKYSGRKTKFKSAGETGQNMPMRKEPFHFLRFYVFYLLIFFLLLQTFSLCSTLASGSQG